MKSYLKIYTSRNMIYFFSMIILLGYFVSASNNPKDQKLNNQVNSNEKIVKKTLNNSAPLPQNQNVIKTENVTKNRTAEKKKSSSNLEVKRPRTPPPAPKEIKGKISSTPLKEKNTELVTENPLKSNEKINKNHQKHEFIK